VKNEDFFGKMFGWVANKHYLCAWKLAMALFYRLRKVGENCCLTNFRFITNYKFTSIRIADF
jgi:hypothetical protein